MDQVILSALLNLGIIRADEAQFFKDRGNLLPCGHATHSSEDECRLASAKFSSESERQKRLCDDLVEAISKPIQPTKHPPYPMTYEKLRDYEAKRFFYRLSRYAPDQYPEQVKIYKQAIESFFALPPCWRDGVKSKMCCKFAFRTKNPLFTQRPEVQLRTVSPGVAFHATYSVMSK